MYAGSKRWHESRLTGRRRRSWATELAVSLSAWCVVGMFTSHGGIRLQGLKSVLLGLLLFLQGHKCTLLSHWFYGTVGWDILLIWLNINLPLLSCPHVQTRYTGWSDPGSRSLKQFPLILVSCIRTLMNFIFHTDVSVSMGGFYLLFSLCWM